ncbi:MAG: CmcI family methyltransferase [Candidatus Limnocylindria bacterium]
MYDADPRTGRLISRLSGSALKRGLKVWERTARPSVTRLFHQDLIVKTGNFAHTTWVGQPIWQNVLDLWTIQETIAEIKPALLIETGTNRGGSALFYAHLMDIMGTGQIITVDILKLHELQHPRVEFVIGSSTDDVVIEHIREAASKAEGAVMVILDGLHDCDHVAKELELYAPLVTPGSLLLSQDGIIDQLGMFADSRPGPLPANRDFLDRHPEFEYDQKRNEQFLLTHHPIGWLRRLH